MKTYRRKVQRIIDGDTFKVRNRVNNSQFIRIAGLNCPERGQRGYQGAKQRLSDRIGGKTVTIKPKGQSYGRTVAFSLYSQTYFGNT